MQRIFKPTQRPIIFPVIGILLGVIFWLLDAIVDNLFFDDVGQPFVNSLLFPDAMDLWMRLLVIALLVAFSFYARRILNAQIKTTEELNTYKEHLEEMVEERTEDLETKNNLLEMEIFIRKKAEEELQQLAITDPLTHLYNRRKFHELLNMEIQRERRYKTGLALILCDLDHFKSINDHFGHDVGDAVIKIFAQTSKENIRETDILARWGGEEFIFLVPATDLDNTLAIAEKLRSAAEKIALPPVERITASFGVTRFDDSDQVESFIKRADDALYLAKKNGRNRVEVLLKPTDRHGTFVIP